eukprot:CAMPEP_0197274802 /NCGR_PEP_ID=MMETSP1432-20130617/13115_1 /TAXON_ID=44447 /ORGANISM="Pseudo-nitzschia delicatissima, Strain UNC1205" /LENGTH=534 /DNA_ID=CAMNT_0042740633 /DNA_START=1 /DNA_END=1605 /DNA_ORIENTATION=-
MLRSIFVFACMVTATTGFVGISRPAVRTFGATTLEAKKYDDCDVAIMGGGFGGLYTALALSREAKRKGNKVDVALVDPSDCFVFLPLLYDLTMGTASEQEVCPTYKELLEGTGIRYIKASFDGFGDDDDIQEAVLTQEEDEICLKFKTSVVAVGATPQSILASVPGAAELAQPFYTKEDAYATRELLFKMEQKIRQGETPKIAVVGGGYGGVELSACVARRLPDASVTLLSRASPMAGTRAEPLVGQALKKLGVVCEIGSIEGIKEAGQNKFTIQRSSNDDESNSEEDEFDAVMWTAGSGPAYPVTKDLGGGLMLSPTGRLKVDKTLRCSFEDGDSLPSVWALGDCSETLPALEPATPKTAQAAMQQADVVALNVLSSLSNKDANLAFEFQDLGSMLSLGGPNAALLGPNKDSQISSLLVPLLDTARVGLGVADTIFAGIVNSPQVDKSGNLKPVVENLGLSLGGYGLGVDPQSTPGTLSGTLTGATRRAVYALRMPTNKQRAYAGASAFLSSAAALAKEASDQIEKNSSGSKR